MFVDFVLKFKTIPVVQVSYLPDEKKVRLTRFNSAALAWRQVGGDCLLMLHRRKMVRNLLKSKECIRFLTHDL